MQLMSSDFSPGGAIPVRFTCEGDNVSPEFSWKESPAETIENPVREAAYSRGVWIMNDQGKGL